MNDTNEKGTTEMNSEISNEQFPVHKRCGKVCTKVHPTEWAEWYWWCDSCNEEVKHPTRQKGPELFNGEAERLIAPFKEWWRSGVPWGDIELAVADKLCKDYEEGFIDGMRTAGGVGVLRNEGKGPLWDEGYAAGANDKTNAIYEKAKRLEEGAFWDPPEHRKLKEA